MRILPLLTIIHAELQPVMKKIYVFDMNLNNQLIFADVSGKGRSVTAPTVSQ